MAPGYCIRSLRAITTTIPDIQPNVNYICHYH
jgi:hypothetical protein